MNSHTELEARVVATDLRDAIDQDTSGCDRWFENYRGLTTRDATEDVHLLAEYVLRLGGAT